ncbi:MAG: type II toxin-antitoxin system RelE/ParE family toxin [Verrucomicrobia bacterium]|nr:type II toxin-antitoxin system RelE/ParE family toxin [Verrucomicrobiota bacterium]
MGEVRYQVILSPRSLQDLEEVVSFIAADNSPAAERFGHELIAEAGAIGPHPLMGRAVPEFRDPAIRERIFRSYRIVYRVDAERRLVIVSRFWHGARGRPEIVPE